MKTMRSKAGFSLVELLTVIAIIAILAAIIFPVMSSVKNRAKETQCMSNLQSIGAALGMYQLDNRAYPEVLSGRVKRDSGGNVIPLERTTGDDGLYPEYIKTTKGFHCPLAQTTRTTGVIKVTDVFFSDGQPYEVYAYDSYDVYYPDMVGENAVVTVNATAIRYYRNWAPDRDSVGTLPPHPPGTTDSDSLRDYDYKRQLRFRAPSKDAVVTWCSYHGAGKLRGKDPVLFLSGTCDTIPAVEIEGLDGTTGSRWRVHPKP